MPATFRLLAMPASFTHCEGGPSDAYDMVSVAMMAEPLLDRRVSVANLDALAPEVDAARAELDALRKPYSFRVILDRASRAPRGWNDSPRRFNRDECFGQYANA